MREIKREVADTPRQKLRHRFDHFHYPLGLSRHDPEGALREANIHRIEEEMRREEEVSMAYRSLKERLERGEPPPRILHPHLYASGSGYWKIYSSQYFTERYLWDIDNMDFGDHICNRELEFHTEDVQLKYSCLCHHPDSWGAITGSREIKGTIKPFDWPEEASLEPIVVQTTSRCRRMKIWFFGKGFLRIECEMGSREEHESGETTTVVWSGIQTTRKRQEFEHRERMAEEESQRAVRRADARRRELQREQWERKRAEEEKQRLEALRQQYLNGDIDSDEYQEAREEEVSGESEEVSGESGESSTEPPDPWCSSTGEEDWTETEDEDDY